MKVIEAFSWMQFVMFSLAFTILLALVSQAQRFGRPDIWGDPIQGMPYIFSRPFVLSMALTELGWFHELPGYYNHHQQGMMQYPMYPQQYGYPMQQGYVQGQQPVYQIHQGPNGTTGGFRVLENLLMTKILRQSLKYLSPLYNLKMKDPGESKKTNDSMSVARYTHLATLVNFVLHHLTHVLGVVASCFRCII
jgi:hypothetical protein